MGTGATTTTTTLSQDWSRDPRARQINPCVHRIGIYGWRKRCLFLLVALLSTMVFVNLALTIWIIKVIDFSVDGMGKLQMFTGGMRLEGEAEFLHGLYAAEIRSRKEQALKLVSSKNVTLNARSSEGFITNRLYIGTSLVESIAEKFTLKNLQGRVLFQTDGKQIRMSAGKLSITGKGGVSFRGSIQTPVLKGNAFKQLRLESSTRTVRVKAPEGVDVESKVGDITAACLKDLKLHSKKGIIWIDSERVELKNLRTAIPTTRGRPYPGIYQLCICENGRLFASPSDSHCQADNSVCR